MGILGAFDTKASNAFAGEIAQEFLRNYALTATFKTDADRERRLVHAIEVIGNRALKYQQQDRLGWYRKSRFLYTIRSVLAEAGHSGETINRVAYEVAMKTSGLGQIRRGA